MPCELLPWEKSPKFRRARPTGQANRPSRMRAGNSISAALQQTPGFMIRILQLQNFEAFYPYFEALKLSPLEYAILVTVRDNKAVTQSELAAVLKMQLPNLVKILSRMEETGVLKRKRSTRDKRAVELSLSAAGERRADEASRLGETLQCADAFRAQQARASRLSPDAGAAGRSAQERILRRERLSAGAADPFGRRIVVQRRHRARAPRQHRALVDVALVGDLAAVDGRRLGQQQRARGVTGRVAALRLQLCKALRDRGCEPCRGRSRLSHRHCRTGRHAPGRPRCSETPGSGPHRRHGR